MILTNIQVDLLQEAILTALRDRYTMQSDMKAFREKYTMYSDLYDILEAQRTHPVSTKQ